MTIHLTYTQANICRMSLENNIITLRRVLNEKERNLVDENLQSEENIKATNVDIKYFTNMIKEQKEVLKVLENYCSENKRWMS